MASWWESPAAAVDAINAASLVGSCAGSASNAIAACHTASRHAASARACRRQRSTAELGIARRGDEIVVAERLRRLIEPALDRRGARRNALRRLDRRQREAERGLTAPCLRRAPFARRVGRDEIRRAVGRDQQAVDTAIRRLQSCKNAPHHSPIAS